MQPPSEVGSFADVRLGLRVVAAKQENGWSGRNFGEKFRVAFGDKLQALD
jgi:hypothetical protein